jgi:hypothetical protein
VVSFHTYPNHHEPTVPVDSPLLARAVRCRRSRRGAAVGRHPDPAAHRHRHDPGPRHECPRPCRRRVHHREPAARLRLPRWRLHRPARAPRHHRQRRLWDQCLGRRRRILPQCRSPRLPLDRRRGDRSRRPPRCPRYLRLRHQRCRPHRRHLHRCLPGHPRLRLAGRRPRLPPRADGHHLLRRHHRGQ